MSDETATPTVTRGGQLRQRWQQLRRSKLAGAIAVFVFGVLGLGGWAMSSPVGSEPDSDFHLSSIWCTTWGEGSPCDMEERRNRKMVPSALIDARCYSHYQDQSAACQPLMTTSDGRETMTNRLNIVESKANYPSGFYLFHNTFAGENVDTAVFGMRMVNVALFVGLNIALWWFLPGRLQNSLAWAWAATLVPLGAFVIASTNPSSWALIGVGSAWIALLGYLEAEGYRRWVLGGFFLVFVGMAAAARTDATLMAIATSGIALFVTDAPIRQVVRRLWIPAVGAILAVGVLLFQRGAIGVLTQGILGDRETFDWGRLWINAIEVPGLWIGSFGGWPWGALGWLDTPMPQLVSFLAFGVFIVLLALGLTGSTWRVRLFTFVMLLMIWVYPLFILQQANELVGLVFQSRYGLPLIPVLLGIALLRPTRHSGILPNVFHRGWILGALSLANSVALHHNIRRYVTGLDHFGLNLNAGADWWWFGLRDSWLSPMAVWLIGSLTFFAALWVVLIWGVDRVQRVAETTPLESNQSAALAR